MRLTTIATRRTAALLLVVFSLSLGILAPAGPAVMTSAAPAADDWPQLGRDAQRTNASPQTVNGPYRYYWRWTAVPLASRVQPVIAAGRLFIGSVNGVMYALDAAYDARGGAPRILWQRDLYSPVRAGAGVAGSIVVVGTHHGAVHGLDAATGQPRWSVSTGGAILAAPLIEAGVAYIGSASGTMYAIRTTDGAVLWQRAIGVPILGSAALSSDGSRIFFVAENVVAYALARDTGAVLWQTQLQGQSGADRWPVVLNDLVVFRTMPIRFFHDLLHDGDDVMDSAGARLADWAADWAIVRPKIIQHLTAKPYDQTFFALDAATGQSRGVAPVLYTFGDNDPPSPPAVYNGALYLPYRARHGIQTDGGSIHVSTRYDAELGRMDPATLDIVGLTSAQPLSGAPQFRLTSDEPGNVTFAGDLLLVDNWERLGGIRLSDRSLVGIAQMTHIDSCNWGPGNALLAFYESCPFPEPRIGEGWARTGAAVGSGRIFWMPAPNGLAAIGPANGITNPPLPAPAPAPTPGPLPGPVAISPSALSQYVWADAARPAVIPADLSQRLEQEVSRIVATNEHLMPFYLERGFHGRGSWPPDVGSDSEPAVVANSNAFWYDPGELVYTLSAAYPYLSPALQTQVKAYLQAEMNRFPPLQPLPWPPDSWLKQGRAREYYPVPAPIRNSLSAWPPPATPIQTIYALWVYARATGDWNYVRSVWPGIQSLFNAKKTSINSYAEIAGAIGYARIAQQLGYPAEASAGEAAAVAAMQAGLNFAQWRDRANALYPMDPSRAPGVTGAPVEPPGRRGGVFFGLTPEVGRYLRDTNLAAVDYTVNDIAGYPNGTYLWYATRVGLQGETGESSYHSPEIGWSVFLAQAYVRQARQTQLRYWLDRPWGAGDLWFIQKLVATIEAPSDAPFSVTLSGLTK
jgi:hypothetical protein